MVIYQNDKSVRLEQVLKTEYVSDTMQLDKARILEVQK